MFWGGVLMIVAPVLFMLQSNKSIYRPDRTVWLAIGMIVTGTIMVLLSN